MTLLYFPELGELVHLRPAGRYRVFMLPHWPARAKHLSVGRHGLLNSDTDLSNHDLN